MKPLHHFNIDDLYAHSFDDFIELSYVAFLGRYPDDDGKQFYLQREFKGASRESILYDIYMSKEHKNKFTNFFPFYKIILIQFLMRRFITANVSHKSSQSQIDKEQEEPIIEYASRGNVLPVSITSPSAETVQYKDNVVYLDVKDVINYIEGGNTTVSGIQRVVVNLFLSRRVSKNKIIPVMPEYDRNRILVPNEKSLEILFKELLNGNSNSLHLISILSDVYQSRVEIVFKPGDIFFIAGAFWIIDVYDLFISMRKENVKIVLFIHDLIQIVNPEYVSEHANLTFTRSFSDIIQVCDLVITNSLYTANDVKHILLDSFGSTISIATVPLATEVSAPYKSESIRPDVVEICSDQYVLYVGTIEVRKNHVYLVKIWERLLLDGHDVPKLVFAGKWGWQIEELRTYLESRNYLDGRIVVLNNLSDSEISELYRNCIFSTYVSFAEGFGLPIAESLSFGKTCICSKTTSIPEVGGDYCIYIDPYNLDDGYRCFKNVFEDTSIIEKKSELINLYYKPKSWDSFCSEVYDLLKEHVTDKNGPVNFIFRSVKLYYFGYQKVSYDDYLVPSIRMTRCAGWDLPSPAGAVSFSKAANLEIPTDMIGCEITLYILCCSTNDENMTVTVSINDSCSKIILSREIKPYKLSSKTYHDGIIKLLFSLPHSEMETSSGFFVGAVGWCNSGYYHDHSALLYEMISSAMIGKNYNNKAKKLSFSTSIESDENVKDIYDLLSYDGVQFITRSYQFILHRECDDSGKINYLRKINNNINKVFILRELLQSDESIAVNTADNVKHFISQLDRLEQA